MGEKIENIDFEELKNMIQSIPDQRIKKDPEFLEEGEKSWLSPQEVIDESYDATLQDIMLEIPCSVYDRSYEQYIDKSIIVNFLQKTTDTDQLQERNVLLTSLFWKDVILEPKENITSGYRQRTVDVDKKRINYSELSANVTSNSSVERPVLTTIQFDFEDSADKTISPLDITDYEKKNWDKLFSKCSRATDVDAIFNTAKNAIDFSIHKFYLPNGVENTEESSLLVRYDHCTLKHKNGAMPKLYKNVYPQSVNEPHFHFNSGFGGLYKLTSDNETHDYGVGYAIGVTGLKNYLEKLYSGDFKDKAEERLYMENDFGMPFLYLLNAGGAKKIGGMIEKLNMLQLVAELGNQDAELEIAMNLINDFTNTEQIGLNFHGIDVPNNENDEYDM